jgi:3-oxoacyl-[acyl-carrier protein] reductase
VRVGTPDEGGVAEAGGLHVVDEATATAEQTSVLDARDPGPDEAAHVPAGFPCTATPRRGIRAGPDRRRPTVSVPRWRLVSSRSALVVGGSGGIGSAVAQACVEEGLGVTLVARRQDRLHAACASLGTTTRVVAMVADAGSPPAIDRAVEAHVDAHGGLDLVVVAVGGGRPGPTAAASSDDVDEALQRDLRVPWQVLRSSIDALRDTAARRRLARFVAVGSVAGIEPVPSFASYSVAKAALRSLVLSVEQDEAAVGVRATVIEPGYVATALTASIGIPAEEMLVPDDVAHAVRFLLHLSPQASVTELVLGRAGTRRFEP